MRFCLDLFPLILFFAAFKIWGIYIATIVAIVSAVLAVVIGRIRTGHFEKVPLVTLISVGVLGTMTLVFKNEAFIKWKPSVVYWAIGLGFIISQYAFNLLPAQKLLGKEMTLPNKIWRNLNLVWALFFLALGFANLYVIYNFSTESWVNFKVFGTLALTIVFVLAQGIYLSWIMKSQTP